MKYQPIQKYSAQSPPIHFQTFSKSLFLLRQVGASVTLSVVSTSHVAASRNKSPKILISTSVACRHKFWCIKACVCLQTYRASILILLIYAWNLLSACSTSVFLPTLNRVGLWLNRSVTLHIMVRSTLSKVTDSGRERVLTSSRHHYCQTYKPRHRL